jgi:hypothetical protein
MPGGGKRGQGKPLLLRSVRVCAAPPREVPQRSWRVALGEKPRVQGKLVGKQCEWQTYFYEEDELEADRTLRGLQRIQIRRCVKISSILRL